MLVYKHRPGNTNTFINLEQDLKEGKSFDMNNIINSKVLIHLVFLFSVNEGLHVL